jgi:hypothetical protein
MNFYWPYVKGASASKDHFPWYVSVTATALFLGVLIAAAFNPNKEIR